MKSKSFIGSKGFSKVRREGLSFSRISLSKSISGAKTRSHQKFSRSFVSEYSDLHSEMRHTYLISIGKAEGKAHIDFTFVLYNAVKLSADVARGRFYVEQKLSILSFSIDPPKPSLQ